MKRVHAIVIAFFLCVATGARADEQGPPPPYSLPWGLRGAAVASVVRSDTVFADYQDAKGNDGKTMVSMLLVGAKLNDKMGAIFRAGYLDHSPPVGEDGNGYFNPVVGVNYLVKPRKDLRVSYFLGLTVPVGQGGGNAPNPATSTAIKSGALARSALDNAMFSVNDVALIPGVDIAYVNHGVTLQWEATVIQAKRVRGEQKQVDRNKTNFTTGIHFGYFFAKPISVGAELRYQRWVTTPSFVEADSSQRDNLSFTLGPRFHARLGHKVWFRPGVSYTTSLAGRMDDLDYRIVQLDLPLYF